MRVSVPTGQLSTGLDISSFRATYLAAFLWQMSTATAMADADSKPDDDVPDPTKVFDNTRKLSRMLVSRAAIIPMAAAALIPFAIAGMAWLPFEEVLTVLKKMLLI